MTMLDRAPGQVIPTDGATHRASARPPRLTRHQLPGDDPAGRGHCSAGTDGDVQVARGRCSRRHSSATLRRVGGPGHVNDWPSGNTRCRSRPAEPRRIR